MVQTRIIETNEGIQDAGEVEAYDQMMRRLSEKGWTVLREIIKFSITSGHALEVGPGPGYLGLDWLKKTTGTELTGLDISENMVRLARKNAEEFGLSNRSKYTVENAEKMPFADNYFDAVFTNGSLHEWEHPIRILNEIHRVLKPSGRFFISDLRRNMSILVKWFMKTVSKPKSIRPGLISSINAAYIKPEIEELLRQTHIKTFRVSQSPMGIIITGIKS
jgi:ubiquinone/menaquinone biosynthesis C-methylase UbiE